MHVKHSAIASCRRSRTQGDVSLHFCIVYCTQGNREQPAHCLKQYKNAGNHLRVYGNCFYLVLHFLSSTRNVILHPLNTHFWRLILRPVYTRFSQQRLDSFEKLFKQIELVSHGISKHSKTINKNTRLWASCFHTLFSRVWISRWNTRSRCTSNISNTRKSVSSGYSNPEKCVEKRGRRPSFLKTSRCLDNLMKHSSECLI